MKTKYLFLLLLFLTASSVSSQSLNLRISAYMYNRQGADSINSDSKTNYLSSYQNALVEVSKDNWSFNTLIQTEEDANNDVNGGFGYRFYNMYIKGTNLYKMIDVKLGRQYLFTGVGKGAIDGAMLKLKAGKNKEYQISGYAGAITPLSYEFSGYKSLNNNFILGGVFSYYGVRDLTASISYMNKRYKPESYTTSRIDSALLTEQTEISFDSRADQLMGLDFNYTYLKKHKFFGKAYFDINNFNTLYKGEFNANFSVNKELKLSLMYEYNEPQISFNSIFWTFAHYQNQEVGGGIDYLLKNGINLYGNISNVFFENDNSLKFQVGFNNPGYGLSYTQYTGYAGVSYGANGYLYRELVKAKLSCNLGLNYSNYSLGNYSSGFNKAFSGLLGITYRPDPQISIDIQGQLITNSIYQYDTRILAGINYRLFKKF